MLCVSVQTTRSKHLRAYQNFRRIRIKPVFLDQDNTFLVQKKIAAGNIDKMMEYAGVPRF